MAVRMMTSKMGISDRQRYLAQIVLTGVLAILSEHLVDLVTDLTVWDLDVVLGGAVLRHEGEETVVSNVELNELSAVFPRNPSICLTYELVLATGDVWNLHVVGGWRQILELLAGEDVNGDKVDLGVTVLASLGGGHLDDLAWALLDDDETVLPQSRTLHWVGERSTGIGALEGVLML